MIVFLTNVEVKLSVFIDWKWLMKKVPQRAVTAPRAVKEAAIANPRGTEADGGEIEGTEGNAVACGARKLRTARITPRETNRRGKLPRGRANVID